MKNQLLKMKLCSGRKQKYNHQTIVLFNFNLTNKKKWRETGAERKENRQKKLYHSLFSLYFYNINLCIKNIRKTFTFNEARC